MIHRTRIQIKDKSGLGSTGAYLMPFINALMQKRMIAFDGQHWFCQANNRAPFVPVSESEVPELVKEQMKGYLKFRTPTVERLKRVVNVMKDLLDNPHPEIIIWQKNVNDCRVEINRIMEDGV